MHGSHLLNPWIKSFKREHSNSIKAIEQYVLMVLPDFQYFSNSFCSRWSDRINYPDGRARTVTLGVVFCLTVVIQEI